MASHYTGQPPLRIVPLGGLGEIGMNCMLFESGEDLFVLDCGVLFSDIQMLGVDFFIPDFTYLKERKDKLKGYIITHGHEDHIGALPFAMKQCPAPIYASPFAQALIKAKLEEHGIRAELMDLVPREPINLGCFTITPEPVNHSIVEAFALFINTPQGTLVHTGDFKIDASPFYGRPMDPKPFLGAGSSGVRLLLSDSTNVERDGCTISEERIYHNFKELIEEAQGLTLIAMFASNVGRVGQVIELARKMGKRVALLGRGMEQNAKHAYDLGYLEGLHDVQIPVEDVGSAANRKDCIVLSTGSQGEYRSGLVRVANNEHKGLKLTAGDTVVMSSRFIPGNEKPISRMINQLFKLGADVIYESVAQVHVSGHASSGELALMMEYTKPEYFVPVHGEYRHLVKHRRLALKNGVVEAKALIAVNGDVLELTATGLSIVEHFDENRIMIEGATGEDVDKVTIKDRRKVAETGIVFAVILRNSVSGEIMAGPDILSRGFLEENSRNDLIDDAKGVMLEILETMIKADRRDASEMQEEVRVGLRRFFNSRIGKKPVVMVILVDV